MISAASFLTAKKDLGSRAFDVGVVGLGKLGTPVALAMSLMGHRVVGFDVDQSRMQKLVFCEKEVGPNGEQSIERLLQESDIEFGDVSEVVECSEIIFVAVQTPHDHRFEGVTRLPEERADFDYSYLKAAIRILVRAIQDNGQEKAVVIISTVLPGTIRREIMPLLNPLVKLCYNPFFIAMGTTIPNFLDPEFVLLGADDEEAADRVKEFYRTLHQKPVLEMSIENAELTKVAYNTFVSMKICYANTLMEVCHKTPGCDVDVVTSALKMATDRLISTKYLTAGMGDGGGCHPRDNIAMSWLAKELDLSYDWFENLMLCREKQTEFLADLTEKECREMNTGLVHVWGMAFKPATNLTVGSPAVLLANILRERGLKVDHFDPIIHGCPGDGYAHAGVFVIATKHDVFTRLKVPPGSVVIDPFRYIPEQEGVKIISVGRGEKS